MKKRYLLTLFVVVLVALISVTPAFAYTGIEGVVIDSRNGDPWTHGGDVYIENGNGELVATCTLNNLGEITDSGGGACDYTDQYISGLSYTGSATGDMTVIIDFSCIESGDTCNPPEGTPKTVEFTYGERSYIGGYYQTGAIETGTGPNSVSLTGLFGTSGMALMGVLPLAAAAGFGAVKFNHKKRQ